MNIDDIRQSAVKHHSNWPRGNNRFAPPSYQITVSPASVASLRVAKTPTEVASPARYSSVKPMDACVPSQNGLLLDCPHRQSVTRLRTW
jgi:hypothetical protein